MQVTDKPWAVCRYGKVVERYGQRNEAIQEAMWAVVGEGYDFNDRDEQSVYLDLREGHEVVGWSVCRAVDQPETDRSRKGADFERAVAGDLKRLWGNK